MAEFSQWSGAAMNTRQLLLVPAAARTEISAVYSPTILADIAPEPVLAAPAISDPLYLENQECFKKKKKNPSGPYSSFPIQQILLKPLKMLFGVLLTR